MTDDIRETESSVSQEAIRRTGFQPGNQLSKGISEGKTGRPKGAKTRMQDDFDIVKKFKDEITQELINIALRKPHEAEKVSRNGVAVKYQAYPSANDQIGAAAELFNRAYGKVKQTVDVTQINETDYNITFRVIHDTEQPIEVIEGVEIKEIEG